MDTKDRFDWYWQPKNPPSSTQILTSTQSCIALDTQKKDTQAQCQQIKKKHQSHADNMQQTLSKIKADLKN
ncbi:hypothetical protein [Shewanella surugensis]|uniref:Uncharacterized protein n=1 Tax=Shewanella surugensis TaxID=212020 RepID=A0ABT0LB84_9GAMM|nr:hypothetical protein [Shewanella surugensis]MCL1124967.1 hypothetical protein [Shewanella surugensis]